MDHEEDYFVSIDERMHKLDYRHRSTSNRPLNDGIRLTYLAAGQNMVVGNTIETVTVLRRPANRPDAQLLESATVV